MAIAYVTVMSVNVALCLSMWRVVQNNCPLLHFPRFAAENVGKSIWSQHPIIGFRRLFYLVGPEETSFEHESQVPNYVLESFPYFGGEFLGWQVSKTTSSVFSSHYDTLCKRRITNLRLRHSQQSVSTP